MRGKEDAGGQGLALPISARGLEGQGPAASPRSRGGTSRGVRDWRTCTAGRVGIGHPCRPVKSVRRFDASFAFRARRRGQPRSPGHAGIPLSRRAKGVPGGHCPFRAKGARRRPRGDQGDRCFARSLESRRARFPAQDLNLRTRGCEPYGNSADGMIGKNRPPDQRPNQLAPSCSWCAPISTSL